MLPLTAAPGGTPAIPRPVQRIVIVGGGFAGLHTARALRWTRALVTLVDRRNFHLFQPLLYQVATGGLSPANIAAPLRSILKRQRNTEVLMAEVVGFDIPERRLRLADGDIAYDTLVVAAGAGHHYFGHDDWQEHAPGLKTIEDAISIRRRVLGAFEAAEREREPARRDALLTFVIVGAGPTGVELAGALAEIARKTLQDDFRHIDPRAARIHLVEGGDRVLPGYVPFLSESATTALQQLGVSVQLSTMVTDVRADGVTLRGPDGETEIAARTVLWAAGVGGSPLGRALAAQTGASLDRQGRLVVAGDLTVPGHPEVFVIGDLAHVVGEDGKPLPGIAPVAMQQGRFVARLIARRRHGGCDAAFRYRDRGSMATIGRSRAVADVLGLRFDGWIAWVTWLFVHLLYIVQFQNRLLVLLQWAWSYCTWARSARLITHETPPPRERS